MICGVRSVECGMRIPQNLGGTGVRWREMTTKVS